MFSNPEPTIIPLITTMESIDDLQLLTAGEAARLLHTTASTVYRLMQSSELRHIQFGRSVRVRRSDLEDFINKHIK